MHIVLNMYYCKVLGLQNFNWNHWIWWLSRMPTSILQYCQRSRWAVYCSFAFFSPEKSQHSAIVTSWQNLCSYYCKISCGLIQSILHIMPKCGEKYIPMKVAAHWVWENVFKFCASLYKQYISNIKQLSCTTGALAALLWTHKCSHVNICAIPHLLSQTNSTTEQWQSDWKTHSKTPCDQWKNLWWSISYQGNIILTNKETKKTFKHLVTLKAI